MNISRLKEIRIEKGLNQKTIAKVINTTQQMYSRYELGIILIPIDRLSKLAKFYNTSTDYLLGITKEKEPYPKDKN